MPANEYLLVEPAVPERRREGSAKGKIAAIVGVICFVAVTIAVVTVSSHNMKSGSSSSGASTGGSSSAASADFTNRHSILRSMPAPTITTFTDNGIKYATSSYSFSYTDSALRTTSLQYSIEHHADFVALESHPNITSASLNSAEGSVEIVFVSGEAAANHSIKVGTHITMRDGYTGGPALCMRVASKPQVKDENLLIVYFKAEPAKLTDFVRSAKVSFSSNHPSDPFEGQSKKQTAQSGSQDQDEDGGLERATQPRDVSTTTTTPTTTTPWRRRRDFDSWLQGAWPEIKQWAGYIYDGLNLVINGDLSIDNASPYAGTWSWGPQSCGFTVPDTTSSCGASLDATVHFSLDIANYSLNSVSLTVDGNTQLSASADFSINEPYSNSAHKQVFNQQLWSGTITLGQIPIPVSVDGVLYAGYNLNADASLNVNANLQVAGTATLGMNYANGQMNWVHDYNLNPTHSISGNAEETATLELNTMPVMLLKAAYIGGPTVQVSMTGQVTLTATQNGEVNDDWNVSGCNHVSASVQDNVQVALGAMLDITIDGKNEFNKDWDFVPFPATTYPLASECIGQ